MTLKGCYLARQVLEVLGTVGNALPTLAHPSPSTLQLICWKCWGGLGSNTSVPTLPPPSLPPRSVGSGPRAPKRPSGASIV